MGKFRTINEFFKKKKNEDGNSKNSTLLGSNAKASASNERSSKIVHNCTLLFCISYTITKKK